MGWRRASGWSSAVRWCAVRTWPISSMKKRGGRRAERASGAALGGAADLHVSAIQSGVAGAGGAHPAAGRADARAAVAAALRTGMAGGIRLLVWRVLLDRGRASAIFGG